MKKTFLHAVLGLGLTLFVLSCNKEKIDPTSTEVQTNDSVYSDGKMLVFSTLEDYEKVVDQPSAKTEKEFLTLVSKMKHTTYAESHSETKSNVDLVGDEYLAQILNSDLAVQIGHWIYRINKADEKVFALSVKNADMYDDLISENISNKSVLEFTIEEDILYLLEDPTSGETKSLSSNCSSSNAQNESRKYEDWIDEDGIYNVEGRRYKFHYDVKVRYDNWGIYRKLFTEFKHWETLWGTWDETHFSFNHTCSWEVRNGSTGVDNHTPTYDYASFPDFTGTGSYWLGNFYEYEDDKIERIHYRSSKCLRYFNLSGAVWYRNKKTRTPKYAPQNGWPLHITHV